MKNMLLLNTFRSIKTTFSRFLAIMSIIAISCGFFAGLKVSGSDLLISAQDYYDKQDLADFRLVSTLGFTDDDLAAVREADGVNAAEAGYSADLFMQMPSGKMLNVKTLSIDTDAFSSGEMLSRPYISEGRLPEAAGECLADNSMRSGSYLDIGDKIILSSPEDSPIEDIISTAEYTVVGLVSSPMYISFERGSTNIGNGTVNAFIYIPEEDYTYEYYTDIYLTAKDTAGLDFWSDKYEAVSDSLKTSLEALADERIDVRVSDIYAEAQPDIDDAQQKINDAKQEYNDNLKKLDETKSPFEALKSAADGVDKILDDFSDTYIPTAVRNVDPVLPAELEESMRGIETAFTKFGIDMPIYNMLLSYVTQDPSDSVHKEASRKTIETYLSSVRKQIAEADSEITDGYKKLADAKEEIDSAEQELADSKAELDETAENAKWYVWNRNDAFPYFVNFETDCGRVNAIANVFPIFFVLVAALVCLNTMTRMVEEQRTQTGTLKALGYSRKTIAAQYLIYSVTASVVGGFIGLAICLKVFPTIIYNAYASMYIIPELLTPFRWDYAAGCIIAAILCTGAAAMAACYSELISVPAQLMRPKPPKSGKRVLLEKIGFIWNRLKFTGKITVRNIARYKSRVIMTVIGVAGCTALLLTGFDLRYSIAAIVDRQYGDIFLYDQLTVASDDIDSEGMAEISDLMSESPDVSEYMWVYQRSTDIKTKAGDMEVYYFVPSDPAKLGSFICLRTREGHDPITLDDSGIVINEKLSRQLDVRAGDEITLKDASAPVKIAAITENYTFNYIYFSPDLYKSLFGEYNNNMIAVDLTENAQKDRLSETLLDTGNVLGFSYSDDGSQKFKDLVESLNIIVLALIVSAGALAFVVLFNLANININERMRELATIKVLGFFDGEVSAYIYRENIVSAVLGTVLGLVLGIFLSDFVISTAEVDAVMFAPDIPAYCFVYAALMTAVFAVAVNVILHFRLKKIDMAASLKAIE